MRALNDDDLMPIGKYYGKPLKDIPVAYWTWFIKNVGRNFYNANIHDYVKEKHKLVQIGRNTQDE